jgi:hypothetical protein
MMSNKPLADAIFPLKNFEVVKYKGKTYGKRIEFNHSKQYIKLESAVNQPEYIPYNQISKVKIVYDPKKWLMWVGAFLMVIVVGLFLILYKVFLPPWEIQIHLKNSEPIKIRIRFDTTDAQQLHAYCAGHIPTDFILEKGKGKKPE